METTIMAVIGAVLGRVRTMSEYIGAKLLDKDPTSYKRISAIEADDDLLRNLVPEAMSQLSAVLGRHSRGFAVNDTVATLTMELSKGHPAKLLPDMSTDLESYLAYSLLAGWLNMVSPTMEFPYQKRAEMYAENICRKASSKSNP